MSVIYDKRSTVRQSQLVHLLRYAQPDAAIELLRPDAEAGRAEVFAELAVIAAEARPAGVRAWLSRLVDTPDAAAMVWAGRQLEERARSDAGELYHAAAAVGSPGALPPSSCGLQVPNPTTGRRGSSRRRTTPP
jgi:hypothetical protein